MKTLTLLILTFTSNAFAEYRAYQYVVTNKIQTSLDQPNSKITLSTLDPISYVAYHGGTTLINVELMRTWICPGDTAGKEICPSPYTTLAQLRGDNDQ